jgi:hypothetical protein
VLKILYALRYESGQVPVYKVDIFNIEFMFKNEELPHEKFLINKVASNKVMDSMKGLSMISKVKSAIKKSSLEMLHSLGARHKGMFS